MIPPKVYFAFYFLCFWSLAQKSLLDQCHRVILFMFSSSNLILLHLNFTFFIYFELIFVYGTKYGSFFKLLLEEIQFSQHLLKRLFFLQGRSWQASLRLFDRGYVDLFLMFLFSFLDICDSLQFQAVLIINSCSIPLN